MGKPIKKLVEILIDNEDKIKQFEFDRGQYPNFFSWNKATGLGRAYRNAKLKVRIINRLLNPTGESL